MFKHRCGSPVLHRRSAVRRILAVLKAVHCRFYHTLCLTTFLLAVLHKQKVFPSGNFTSKNLNSSIITHPYQLLFLKPVKCNSHSITVCSIEHIYICLFCGGGDWWLKYFILCFRFSGTMCQSEIVVIFQPHWGKRYSLFIDHVLFIWCLFL